MPVSSMKDLLEAGVHFGHHTRKWNPKMKMFIYGERNDIYIIDLHKTRKKLEEAYETVRQMAFQGKRFLFVGTKKQAQDAIKEGALECEQFYINHRWLGGMLTNWGTIQTRIDRLNQLDKMVEDGTMEKLPKKEQARLNEERTKLDNILGGIRTMNGLPDVIFIIDCKKEHIAIREAHRLEIPIVAVVDTNCDPDEVDYVIPGNDDAIRAVKLMASQMAEAINEGRTMAISVMEERALAAQSGQVGGAVHIGEGGRIEYVGAEEIEMPSVATPEIDEDDVIDMDSELAAAFGVDTNTRAAKGEEVSTSDAATSVDLASSTAETTSGQGVSESAIGADLPVEGRNDSEDLAGNTSGANEGGASDKEVNAAIASAQAPLFHESGEIKMAEITAAQVKKLRDATGLGMMDCKKALVEVDGDFDNAVTYLREKNKGLGEKKADREANEGAIGVYVVEDGATAAIIEVNCETDFVGKNEAFRAIVADLAYQAAYSANPDIESFLSAQYIKDESKTVREYIVEGIAAVSENIVVKRIANVGAQNGVIGAYVHSDGLKAALVVAEGATTEEAKEAARGIAMQAVALRAPYLNRQSVPEHVIEAEKALYKTQAAEEGKPEAMQEKIAEGRLGKYYGENTLTEQKFIRDESGKKSVADIAKEVGVTIENFVRFEVGQV